MNLSLSILGREVLSIQLDKPTTAAAEPKDGPTTAHRHAGDFGFHGPELGDGLANEPRWSPRW